MNKGNLIKCFLGAMKAPRSTIALLALLTVQQIFILKKDFKIDYLLNQNADLKEDIFGIQDQLLELEEGASDIRMFQNEMKKILKDIHHNYPPKIIAGHNETRRVEQKYDIKERIKNAYQNIFKLSSSQKYLHLEGANLLADAVFIRRILSKTPSLNPLIDGQISSPFGPRLDPITQEKIKMHQGLDFAAPVGTPVYASADGKVKQAGYNRDLGYYVDIEHEGGLTTRYGHLKQYSVNPDDMVKRGQQIASVGKTGRRCTGSNLHYEVINKDGKREDPKNYLISSPSQVF